MITDYITLKDEVVEFSHRADLTARMDTFCQLAEAMINYGYEYNGRVIPGLRNKDMEKRTSQTFSSTFHALPDDFVELIALEVEISGKRRPLRQVSPQILDDTYAGASGAPRAYTIQGGEIEFRPAIDATAPYTGEIRYIAEVPTLVSNSTNNVLSNLPHLYLAAMLYQVGVFTDDSDMVGLWASAFNSAIRGANKTKGKYVLPRVRVA